MGNRQGKALTYHGNDRSFAKMAARNCQQQYPDIDDAPPLPHSPAHGEFRKDDIGTDTTNNEYFGRPGGMELSDFNLIRSVGRGSFGRVMIVSRRSDNRIFALKYISKAQCIRQKAVRNVINERRILQRLSHPLVCNLQAAFQDDEHMYIMLDPMMGGDLAFHLERCEYFPENVVKSYICEIALALRYLHKQRIVHR
jgi:serine/threonine kinase 32